MYLASSFHSFSLDSANNQNLSKPKRQRCYNRRNGHRGLTFPLCTFSLQVATRTIRSPAGISESESRSKRKPGRARSKQMTNSARIVSNSKSFLIFRVSVRVRRHTRGNVPRKHRRRRRHPITHNRGVDCSCSRHSIFKRNETRALACVIVAAALPVLYPSLE